VSQPRDPSIYPHPLAYLVGLEGIALLRAFAGEYDRDFTLARLAEVRALLDCAEELGEGAAVGPISTEEGYRSWAELYDEPGNQLVDLEQPVVRESSTAYRAAWRSMPPAARAATAPISRSSGTR
jgi:hypothetical protein